MQDQRITWEDLEENGMVGTGQIIPPNPPPPASPGVPFDFGGFLERVVQMMGYAVEILDKAPATIQGGLLKKYMTSKQTPTNGNGHTEETPEDPGVGVPTPGKAFVALYQFAQFLALSLPTVTVKEVLDLLEGHKGDMLSKLKGVIESNGLEDTKLHDLLLFALPLKQTQITEYLARIPELEAKREAGG